MRLLFVNRFFHPDISATSQMLTDLAVGLARSDLEVGVISSRIRYERVGRRLPSSERYEGVDVRRVGSTGFGRQGLVGRSFDYLSFASSARRSIAAHADGETVVIVKTDPPMLGAFLSKAIAGRGARCVNWVQDLFPEIAEEAGVPLWPFGGAARLRRLRDEALANSAATVAVGERMAERIRATGRMRGAVHMIPNWADGRVVAPVSHERNAFRRAHGLEGKFVVGYAGNFGRAHEFDTMLEAARQLRSDPRIRFLFTGGGTQAGRILEAVKTAPALSHVVFEPYQPRERLAEMLGASDVHLCTLQPRFEGLVVPSKIYGIMAAGRPCIFVGDADGEVARLTKRGGFGFNVAPGDSDSLVRCIRALASDADECARLGRNAREMFEREFDLPVALARWRGVLESLDTARSASPAPHSPN